MTSEESPKVRVEIRTTLIPPESDLDDRVRHPLATQRPRKAHARTDTPSGWIQSH